MNKVLHYSGGSSDKVYVGSVVKKADGKFHVIATWGKRGSSSQGTQNKGAYSNQSMAERELDALLSTKTKKGYEDIEGFSYNGTVRMTDRWLQSWLQQESEPTLAVAIPATAKEIDRMISDKARTEASELLKNGHRINAVKIVRQDTGALLEPAKEYIDEILEPRVKASKSMAPKAGEKDFEVICVNNLGMEESFDEGVTYVAEPHSDKDYIYVWDRHAIKQEVFSERFKKSEVEVSSLRDMRIRPQVA